MQINGILSLFFLILPQGIISVNSRRTPFTASGENEILDLEGDLYLGGLPDNRVALVLPTELWTAMLNYGYVGCVRDLFVDGRSKDIRQIAQSQNMTGVKSSCNKLTGKQCDSNPCKHNGLCKEGWNRFICDCTGTGYWDSSCEKGEITSTPSSLLLPLSSLSVILLLAWTSWPFFLKNCPSAASFPVPASANPVGNSVVGCAKVRLLCLALCV